MRLTAKHETLRTVTNHHVTLPQCFQHRCKDKTFFTYPEITKTLGLLLGFLLLLFLFLLCLASFSYSSHKPKKQSCPRGCVGILLIFSLLPRYYEYFFRCSACLLWKQRALPPSSKLPNLRQELSVVVHNDNLSVLSVERIFVSSHYPLDFVFFLFSLVCTTAIPSCVAATWELNVPLCS